MNGFVISVVVLLWFWAAYRFYGSFIEKRLISPDSSQSTPAVTHRDDIDFVPAKPLFLWGHHFASIAGAGPVIGPILAVSYFGWGYTTLWITLGSVFIGAVHDYLSLMFSVRNEGQGVAKITGVLIKRRSGIALAILLWINLLFITAVFAVSAAKALVGEPSLVIPTFGVIAAALLLGFSVHKMKVSMWLAAPIAIIGAYFLIWVGYVIPVSLPASWGADTVIFVWITLLFAYCLLASLLPVWCLLQPRDFISSTKLFVGMILGFAGIVFSMPEINAPFNVGIFSDDNMPVWPMLFIIVACGAVSGFHTIVATGTTSKQLDSETNGKPIGFGGMIMEGVLAFLVVMVVSCGLHWGFAPEDVHGHAAFQYFGNALKENWIIAFGNGFGNILSGFAGEWIDIAAFSLMGAVMVKTFVMTTLDTATRLGRFVFVETVGVNSSFWSNRFVSTLVLLLPAYILALTNSYGNIWKMFGSSNQLIASMALLAISAWLGMRKKATIYTLAPAVFMLFTSVAALLWGLFRPGSGYVTGDFNPLLAIISIILLFVAFVVSIDAVSIIRKNSWS